MRACLIAVLLLLRPMATVVRAVVPSTVIGHTTDALQHPTSEQERVPPRVTKQVAPKYPRAALERKIEGEVVVEFLIDTKGRVSRARVVQSVPGLDEAAIECVRKWRFTPELRNGRPIAAMARVPVRFKIH